jgi:hypothetical protein
MHRFLFLILLASCGPAEHVQRANSLFGLSIGDATAKQGEPLDFQINLGRTYDEDVTIKYSTLNITAKNPDDFIPESNKEVHVPVGESSGLISVPTYNTRVIDQPVSVVIIVESASDGKISKELAVGTITPAP